MKLKSISRLLAFSIFIQNLNILSFANSLSEDGRYETFEGSNIKIDNILEEDKVDTVIQGDTLVNLLGTQGTATVNLINSGYRVRDFNNIHLKSNTTYTACVNIANLSSNATSKLKLYYKAFNESGGVISVYPSTHFSKENIREGLMTIVFNTDDRKPEGSFHIYVDEMSGGGGGTTNEFSFNMNNCMVLEGDWSNKEIPEYFEGIKSAGEDAGSIKIKSQNKNLFNINNFKKMDYTFGLPIINENNRNFIIDNNNITYTAPSSRWNVGVGGIYKVKKNTNYTAKYEEAVSDKAYNMSINIVGLYKDDLDIDYWNASNRDKYTPRILRSEISLEETNASLTYNSKNYDYLAIYIGGAWIETATETRTITLKNVGIYEGEDGNISYERHISSEKELLLNEPLRGLPNGVKDKIIKKDGKWVIERNCAEITFDGDENWIKTGVGCNDTITTFTYEYSSGNKKSRQIWGSWQIKEAIADKLNCIGDELYFNTVTNEGYAQGHSNSASTDRWYIGVLNNRLSSTQPSAFKEWLTKNPITIVYQLTTPIYEPLNVNPTINLYLDTTYVSNNSSIPINMKLIIDRTPNKAKEAIELAKTNPTIENVSQARYWTNLMKESTLKDSFQSEISNNNIDMKELSTEKKTAYVNSDIYIKPKNILSLSLDTNNIVFDNIDATESTEKLNAVNLSVISSLPYKINAYLEEEIYNSDKTEILDKSILSIRANNTSEYKSFANLSSATILLDNQEAGVNNTHDVDLKIAFNTIPKVDVYKTTIKFEVEQK